jgi:hypothetical protein
VAANQTTNAHPAGDAIDTSIVPSVSLESNGTGSIQFVWRTTAPRGIGHSEGRSCLMPQWRTRSLMWSTGRLKNNSCMCSDGVLQWDSWEGAMRRIGWRRALPE